MRTDTELKNEWNDLQSKLKRAKKRKDSAAKEQIEVSLRLIGHEWNEVYAAKCRGELTDRRGTDIVTASAKGLAMMYGLRVEFHDGPSAPGKDHFSELWFVIAAAMEPEKFSEEKFHAYSKAVAKEVNQKHRGILSRKYVNHGVDPTKCFAWWAVNNFSWEGPGEPYMIRTPEETWD